MPKAKARTAKKKRKRTGSHKASLTATPKGFVKRIGYVAVMQEHDWPDKPTGRKLKKWYLGHDEAKARLLAAQLQRVWEIRKDSHFSGPRFYSVKEKGRWFPGDIAEFKVMKAKLYGTKIGVDLAAEVVIPFAEPGQSPMRYILDGSAELDAKFTRIYDKHAEVMASVRTQCTADVRVGDHASYQIDENTLFQDGEEPRPQTQNATLFGAIDAFEQHIKESESRSIGWRHELCRRVDKIRTVLGDMPVSQFGWDSMSKVVDAWVASAKKGKIAVETSLDYIRAGRQFCDWLDVSDFSKWQAPKRWEKLFAVSRTKLAAGGTGRKVIGSQIRTFTIDELKTLYAAATGRCRLFLLLGLNCGWTQSDVATLTSEHLHLKSSPPYAERNRGKTGVYGRWFLWPETVEALRAETKGSRRRKNRPLLRTQRGKPLLWLNEMGNKIDSIATAWWRLRIDVEMKEPGMSFKHVRKTGSQLVRDVAGKELSEAFLCHSDQTTGRHYNKFADWSKMKETLAKVRERLQPVFDASQ